VIHSSAQEPVVSGLGPHHQNHEGQPDSRCGERAHLEDHEFVARNCRRARRRTVLAPCGPVPIGLDPSTARLMSNHQAAHDVSRVRAGGRHP